MAESKVPVKLGPVQETLLIPLLGRVVESQRPGGMLQDPKAIEILEVLDYDFDKWGSKQARQSAAGAAMRTRAFDTYVERFVAAHPRGTVVEIGCGLNTRFERVDNGTIQWFDLDLPDAIALRRQFFDDTARRTMLAASVLDTDWMEPVAATGGPWLFVAEAVLIYLDHADARRAIEQLGSRFAAFELVFDTTDRTMIARQRHSALMKALSQDSWFRWACDDPTEIQGWVPGLTLADSGTFIDAAPDLMRGLPGIFGFVARYAPWLLRLAMKGYRLNRFVRTEA